MKKQKKNRKSEKLTHSYTQKAILDVAVAVAVAACGALPFANFTLYLVCLQ